MKKVAMSLLAVAAFGTTIVGTQTAEAEGWLGSGWYPVGQNHTMGGGATLEGFIVAFSVGAPVVPAGTTVSANITGQVSVPGATNGVCVNSGGTKLCPTTHAAVTLCQNNDMIIGNWVLATSGPGGAGNNSSTSNIFGLNAAYYLANGQQGIDTGFCPASQSQVKGGAFLYQF